MLEAPNTILIEPVFHARKVLNQCFAVACSRFRNTQGVNLEADSVNSEALPHARTHNDEFGVDIRPCIAERLYVELVKLPVTALLRLLVAEHRARGPEFLLLVMQQAVGHTRPGNARGRFRPERQTFAIAILKRIHLFLDDIGYLADRTPEEFRVLEYGQSNFGVTV